VSFSIIDRDAQHCSKRARERLSAFMYLGRLIEFGPQAKFLRAEAEGRRRVYVTGRFG